MAWPKASATVLRFSGHEFETCRDNDLMYVIDKQVVGRELHVPCRMGTRRAQSTHGMFCSAMSIVPSDNSCFVVITVCA
jgi:hypothetical protein